MTTEQKEEIESYLIAGGYAEQLNDILICEDLDLEFEEVDLSELEESEPFEFDSLLSDIEPIEFEELY